MKKLEFTTIYSFIHCLVDFSTATLIAGILTPTLIGTHILAISILIYNIFMGVHGAFLTPKTAW